MRRALLFLVLLAIAVSGQEMDGDRADFRTGILPILQDRCFECHSDRKKKPKGGLRLDSKSWILLGGKSGPVVVAGKPDRSPMYLRCSLPEDDDDIMPPSGEVLGKEQLAAIKSWIEAGAPFGDWTGEGGEAQPVAKTTPVDPSHERDRLRLYRELDEQADAAPGAAVKKAEEAGARVTPVLPGGKLLRVEFVTDAQRITDKEIASLAGLRKQIAILSLAGTGAGDGALAEAAKMPGLVRLDLQRTAVTDEGLKALAKGKPPHLRRLNLYGTAVTDAGLDVLATLPGLDEVYVWDAKVTAAGVQRLEQMRRGCRVHWRRELPAPAAPRADDDAVGGGRRRKK